MTISKELLSKVLHGDIQEFTLNNEKNIDFIFIGNYDEWKTINIYELTHKCKEWALNKECELSSWVDGRCGVIIKGEEMWAELDTEPEAIFQACEWILEQENK